MPWFTEAKRDMVLEYSNAVLKKGELYHVKKNPDNEPWTVVAWKVGTDETWNRFYITVDFAREVFNKPFWREPSNAMDSKE